MSDFNGPSRASSIATGVKVWPSKRYATMHRHSLEDPEAFWDQQARKLDWYKTWDHVLEWREPYARWFVGGRLNACYQCVDRHVHTWRRSKVAIYWEGENGETRVLSYSTLFRKVNRFARTLLNLGIRAGDRVALYLPMIPELPVAMLACARIGAVHTVIFSGFSAQAIREQDRRHPGQTDCHRRRRPSPGQNRSPQGYCRSCAAPLSQRGKRHRGQADGTGDHHAGRTRPLVLSHHR